MKRIKSCWAVLVAMAMSAVTLTSCTDYQDEIDGLDSRVTALEQLVADMNTNLSSLSSIVTAMESGDYITNVTSNSDGYIVTFAKAGAITVKNGTNGIDAVTPVILPVKDTDGNYYWQLNGEWMLDADGNKVRANGKDGAGASAPVVGQKQDTDGNYYWTLNGEWLIVDGHKVRANGLDGTGAIAPQVRINPSTNEWEVSTDGGTTWNSTGVKATGNDGADAVSPQVRINPSTNEWEVSTDGGSTWTGTGVNATGSDGVNAQSLIKSIVDGEDFVTITLSDDSVINIPKTAEGEVLEKLQLFSVGTDYYMGNMYYGQKKYFTAEDLGLSGDLTFTNIMSEMTYDMTINGDKVIVSPKQQAGSSVNGYFKDSYGHEIYVSIGEPSYYMLVNNIIVRGEIGTEGNPFNMISSVYMLTPLYDINRGWDSSSPLEEQYELMAKLPKSDYSNFKLDNVKCYKGQASSGTRYNEDEAAAFTAFSLIPVMDGWMLSIDKDVLNSSIDSNIDHILLLLKYTAPDGHEYTFTFYHCKNTALWQ